MKTISVSLEDRFDNFIANAIASGKNKNESEVIQEALRLLEYVTSIHFDTDRWHKQQKSAKSKAPQSPIDVLDALPEMKIELINGKIVWGGQPIIPDTEFEKAIAEVINHFMERPSADIILFAAYLTECVKSYNSIAYDIR